MYSRGKKLVELSLTKLKAAELDETAPCSEEIKSPNDHDYNGAIQNSIKENTVTDDYEDIDYDDEVRDPDWKPPEPKKKRYTVLPSCSSFLENNNSDDDLIPTNVKDPNLVTSDPIFNRSISVNLEFDEKETEVDSIPDNTGENSINSTVVNEEIVQDAVENLDVDHEEVVDANDVHIHTLTQKIDQSAKTQKERNKRRRMAGLKYMGVKSNEHGKKTFNEERQERILKPSKCTKWCNKEKDGRQCKRVSEDNRRDIFSKFWQNMNWEEKRVYVLGLIEKSRVSRRTVDKGENSRRQFSLKYFLRVGEQRILVCKDMFLSTLGLHEKMVYKWVNAADSGVPEQAATRDEVEDHEEGQPLSAKGHAKVFLDELPKVPSHYCRATTSKQYIEPLFTTMKELHDEYTRRMQSDSKPVLKITQFTKLFKKMNFSLFHPKKDLCDTCCAHDAGTIEEDEYASHIKKKEGARASKQKDKDKAQNEGNIKVITVDLQSLLLCPKLNASCLYYKTKLSCHNYTVFDLASRSVVCYFWHEADGELTANVFASCLIDYLENQNLDGIETVIIYSDGCGYQNRNATLSNALSQFSVKHKITIEQKFLERGHTQMECDSIHSVIERSMKNKAIYVPQQYIELIERARKDPPYKVNYLDFTFFKDFSKVGRYLSIRPGTGVGAATVSDIRLLKYTDDGAIHYKTDYDAPEYQPLPTPRKASSNVDMEPTALYDRPLPVKRSKFDHLQQLKQVMPRDYHGFYDAIPHY